MMMTPSLLLFCRSPLPLPGCNWKKLLSPEVLSDPEHRCRTSLDMAAPILRSAGAPLSRAAYTMAAACNREGPAHSSSWGEGTVCWPWMAEYFYLQMRNKKHSLKPNQHDFILSTPSSLPIGRPAGHGCLQKFKLLNWP